MMDKGIEFMLASKVVAFSLMGCATAMFGEWGIATMAYVSAIADLIFLLPDKKEKKRFEGE